ncbi:MAG: type II toxin-antitoxin system VapC family toxin [Gammaproteobacteria bacterium]|nr:type II toxin-antitoxin system VapC family toxin [Gammaproteobacteria bacterium]
MGIIVDTNVLIDIESGRLNINAINRFSHYGEAYISVITVSELLTGVHLAKTPDERIRRSVFVEGIISNITSLNLSERVARTYAELYALALQSKKNINRNTHDLQIAATAIHHGYAVLTSNDADFKKIPGLRVERP